MRAMDISIRWPGSRSGFTLVELLVVIVILAIAAGVVSLSIAPSEDRLLVEEAERLAALFRLAQDEARISGRPLSWQADRLGYRFFRGGTPGEDHFGGGTLREDHFGGDTPRENDPDDPLRARNWPFQVQAVEAPKVVFGAEPLLAPCEIHIATSRRRVVLAMDAFGILSLRQ